MANRFPQPPAATQLTGVAYAVTFPPVFSITPASPFAFAGGSTVPSAWFHAGLWGMRFAFDVPGQPGTFDQDRAEQWMKVWLQHTVQAMAVVTGIPPATVAASVGVQRQWEWTDGGAGRGQWAEPWAWTAGLTFLAAAPPETAHGVDTEAVVSMTLPVAAADAGGGGETP